MSNRRSDQGTLADRLRPAEARLPRHVLVQRGGTWVPGLLLEWVNTGQGWYGRAAWAHGIPVQLTVGLVASTELKPLAPQRMDSDRSAASPG